MRRSARHAAFTLLELMIAVLIALVLVAGVYRLFVNQSRAIEGSQAVSELQDNARIAMDFLVRDVRQAGFLIASNSASSGNQPLGAIRIENNCGGQANGGVRSPDFKTVSNTIALGGASAVSGGDIVGDTVGPPVNGTLNEKCPGGSDRLMIVFRPRPDYSTGADYDAGSSHHLLLNCVQGAGGLFDCTKPFTNGGLSTTCGGGCSTSPTTMCNGSDPNSCVQVWIKPGISNAGSNPPCSGSTCDPTSNTSAVCNVDVYSAAGCSSPFTTPANWNLVGGKTNAAFNGFTFRTYQLLDVDGDGSTELVYSDDVQGAEISAGGSVTWTVIANDIDDFQVAYETKKYPGTFNSGSLLNFASTNCTDGSTASYVPSGFTSHEKDPECMTSLYTNSDYPTALRISIVARTAKKVLASSTESVVNVFRTQVEDNYPASTTFNPAAPNWTGSGNGNEQGYRRRVLTEIVSLRNLSGFNF